MLFPAVDRATRLADLDEPAPVPDDAFEAFAADASTALRRALVARYGVQLGVDAAAEALAWAAEHRQRLAAMDNPTGYLYRVGQSAVRRQARLERRMVDLPVEERPVEGGTGDPDPSLHEALAALHPDQRAAVVLVHAHGYPYAEAAALLDIPVSTLKNHLHRGRARLRAELEGRS